MKTSAYISKLSYLFEYLVYARYKLTCFPCINVFNLNNNEIDAIINLNLLMRKLRFRDVVIKLPWVHPRKILTGLFTEIE